MFRSFIYLDEDKLYTYKRQIDGEGATQSKQVAQKKTKGFSAGVKGIGVKCETETLVNSTCNRDTDFDYDQFEQDLCAYEGTEYYDFVLNSDYDLFTIPPMNLVRICHNFQIPESFDLIALIDLFKPILVSSFEGKSKEEHAAVESLLNNASADIPIVFEQDEFALSGKLKIANLREDYSNLEEYADQDVYMLCKVIGIVNKSSVEIFDPLKDFIRLPRSLRRQADNKENSLGIESISIEGPVMKVEVIAIYK